MLGAAGILGQTEQAVSVAREALESASTHGPVVYIVTLLAFLFVSSQIIMAILQGRREASRDKAISDALTQVSSKHSEAVETIGENYRSILQELSRCTQSGINGMLERMQAMNVGFLAALEKQSRESDRQRAEDVAKMQIALEHSTQEIARTRAVLERYAGGTNGARAG